MKTSISILFFLIVNIAFANPFEGTRVEDLNINTQRELDNLKYIEEVGNLIIASEGVDQIVDLSNLRSLKVVRGSVYIINNKELETLNGLSLSVYGDVYILRNVNLKKLSDNFVGGRIKNITIKDNNLLQDVEGFGRVTSIESITVSFNKSLRNLNGFTSIKEITGDVEISNNDQLMYFQPFKNILFFEGNLKVKNNKLLYESDGLYKLLSMASKSEVNNNTVFTTNIELMKIIFEGKGKLKFTSQNELDIFGKCYQKKTFDGDIVIDRSNITNINALKCLNKINGKLIIKRNDNLVSVDGLSHLVSINNLIISFNKNLNSLSGLENLSTVKNNVVIYRNTYLTDTSSLSENMILGGKLVIKSNPRLVK